MRMRMTATIRAAAVFAAALTFSACNGTGEVIQGTDVVHGLPVAIPPGAGDGPVIPEGPSSGNSPEIGEGCKKSDPEHICLGLKYVVYANSSGTPVISADVAAANIPSINKIWDPCNIGFQIDDFVAANPADYGLTYNTANSSELNSIRRAFTENDKLLVVTTASWNRSGTLGSTGANAWANMPGSGLYGVIMESPVGDFPNIIAHELGHYLNLPHLSDASDLMNPTIYSTSTGLSSSQCGSARQAAKYWWAKMMRI